MHRRDVRRSLEPARLDVRPAAPYLGLDEPLPGSGPTSDVLCRLQAPPLGSSPRGQLTARAVTGRAVSPASQNRLTYARWGAHAAAIQNAFRRVRRRSVHHAFTLHFMAPGERCHETTAHRFTRVRTAACIHTTTISLGLDAHDFARASRCVRPTSAIHCLPNSVPALLVSDPLGPPSKEWCDRRIRRFTTRWTRFGGSCGDEEGYWPSRWGFGALRLGNQQRDLAPLTTSPLTPRHPARHASAFPGRLAWNSKDRDRFPRTSWKVRVATIRDAFLRNDTRFRFEQLPAWIFRCQSGCPPLASPPLCLRARRARMFDAEICNLNSDARARTVVRAPTPLPAPDCRPVCVERSCPFERPTRESHVGLRRCTWYALRHPDSLYAFFAFREHADSCFESVTPLPRAWAPSFPGALHTSTEPTTVPQYAGWFRVFRRIASRPATISWWATRAEACETKDPCAPTPQGSGAARVPLLAGGPEHPLSSPRVRARLELPRTSWRSNPKRPRPLVASAPAKAKTSPKARMLGTVP